VELGDSLLECREHFVHSRAVLGSRGPAAAHERREGLKVGRHVDRGAMMPHGGHTRLQTAQAGVGPLLVGEFVQQHAKRVDICAIFEASRVGRKRARAQAHTQRVGTGAPRIRLRVHVLLPARRELGGHVAQGAAVEPLGV